VVSLFILLDETYSDFRFLLCHMQLENVILETDAPYLQTSAEKFGSPMLLQDIATRITSVSSCSFDDVVETTTRNALQLYNIIE